MQDSNKKRLTNTKKSIVFIIIAVTIFIVIKSANFSDENIIKSIQITITNQINKNYYIALLLYIFIAAFGCSVFALPGIIFAIVAGALFDPIIAGLLCSFGTTLGAIISFLISRYFLKDSIKPKIIKNKMLNKMLFSKRIENEIAIIALTRLIPLFPFTLQNYAYGITDISLLKYAICTFIFSLPGVFLFTFISAGIIDEAIRSKTLIIVSLISIVITVLTILVGKRYRKRFGEEHEN